MVVPSTGLPPTDQSNLSVPALSAEHQNAGSEEMKSDLREREREEEEGGKGKREGGGGGGREGGRRKREGGGGRGRGRGREEKRRKEGG